MDVETWGDADGASIDLAARKWAAQLTCIIRGRDTPDCASLIHTSCMISTNDTDDIRA